MPMYLLTQRALKNDRGAPDPAAAAAAAAAWFERLGANLLARSNPVVDESTLGNCGSDTEQFACTLVTADDREAAVAMAGGCLILVNGGGLEVRELASSPVNPGFQGFS